MKKIYLTLVITVITLQSSLFTTTVTAQDDLWITGSAVPGGTQQLVKCPSGIFKYAGTLNEGELKITTTETPQQTTRYFNPRYVQSYIINNGIDYTSTTNKNGEPWVVPFTENRYRIVVNTQTRKVTGELFVPWKEVFMAGGAASCGWHAFVMVPFTQDANDPNVFTWTGQLNAGELKFTCDKQSDWNGAWFMCAAGSDVEPTGQTEQALFIDKSSASCKAQYLDLNVGDVDQKWKITQSGTYTITLDQLHETVTIIKQ